MIIVKVVKKYLSTLKVFLILICLIFVWNIKANAQEETGIVKDSGVYDVIHISENN